MGKKKNREKMKKNVRKLNVDSDIEKNIDGESGRVERIEKGNARGKKVRKKKKNKAPLTKEQIIKKKKRRIIRLFIILIIFMILLVMFLISLYKWNKIMKDIINIENSVILDSSGNVVAVLGETRIQQTVGLDKIPKNLINAYVSIEDKNFYKHHGINVKRTIGAIGSYIVHRGLASYGGSTITQQLVKNITGENENSILRKITEWDRAIKTEMVLTKDQIMQTYLNIIYVGPNIYGVEMGARYYFNKSVSDLNLAECAFLAGLNHSPNSYNPFRDYDNEEKIKSRTITVLNVMLDEKYISNEEYNRAVAEVNEGLNFEEGEVEASGDGVYSYMVDATISEIISDLKENKKMSSTFATNYLYLGGLKIYSTQNSDIQKKIEDEFAKDKYMIKSTQVEGATSQAAMVVIDHETGYVRGCVGRFR